MIIKTFFHTLPDGTNGKFTIRDRLVNGELFYFACVVNIDLKIYTDLSEDEQSIFYGIEITNGKQKVVYYKNADLLLNDIINKYGIEYLETEI